MAIALALAGWSVGGSSGDDKSGGTDTSTNGPSGEAEARRRPALRGRGGDERAEPHHRPVRRRPRTLMGNAVFDPLAHLDDKGDYSPYLAESITPNDDFTRWTVKLRPGHQVPRRHSAHLRGVEVTFELALADPLVGLAIKPLFRAAEPGRIVDDLTARTTWRSRTRTSRCTRRARSASSRRRPGCARPKANPDLNQRPVGTGPFKFKSRTQDSSTKFVRNDDWWNGQVYLDGIEFVVQTDARAACRPALAGDLDVMHTSDPSAIALLRDEPDLTRIEDNKGEEGFVMINTQAAAVRRRAGAQGAGPGHPEEGLPRGDRAGHHDAGRQHVPPGV